MDDRRLEELIAVIPPLLACLEALGLVARHPEPAEASAVLEAVAPRYIELRAAAPALADWPGALSGAGARLSAAAALTLAIMDDALAAADAEAPMLAVARALRRLPSALEAIWPFARDMAPVGRFFLDPPVRQDAGVALRLASAPASPDAGLVHVDGGARARGGYSVFAPDDYAPDRLWPLIVALHGGFGDGRRFVWSLLREARSYGALLVTPTSLGETWSLHEPEADTANLERILGEVGARWRIAPDRRLLTGMSDGGTFAYIAGLAAGSSYSHLAPTAAAWHPILLGMAGEERLHGLPIRITHGARDWMFSVGSAREAAGVLAAAGADVELQVIADLGHAWPREIVRGLIAWSGGA
ncbi:MAG TPA: hypothetical protein VG248_10265 [Caulobacteraceae bacterium]|jgi:phospholipase/carboxylesterase|nr:hypothetical protein [Caulobacteraceae bacterium]